MVGLARSGGDGPRRRWPWTIAAVALASALAAARARAHRRAQTTGETTEVNGAADRPNHSVAARQATGAAKAAATQVAERAVAAAEATTHIVGQAVARLKDKAARRQPHRPGEDGTASNAKPPADSPASGQNGAA
jgi:hypothetical protein